MAKLGGGKAHTLTFQNVPGDKNASLAHLETGTDKNGKTRNTLCICFPTVFVDLKWMQNWRDNNVLGKEACLPSVDVKCIIYMKMFMKMT